MGMEPESAAPAAAGEGLMAPPLSEPWSELGESCAGDRAVKLLIHIMHSEGNFWVSALLNAG